MLLAHGHPVIPQHSQSLSTELLSSRSTPASTGAWGCSSPGCRPLHLPPQLGHIDIVVLFMVKYSAYTKQKCSVAHGGPPSSHPLCLTPFRMVAMAWWVCRDPTAPAKPALTAARSSEAVRVSHVGAEHLRLKKLPPQTHSIGFGWAAIYQPSY